MRVDDVPMVRQLRLFAGMSNESFADLVQGAFLQRFPSQVVLVEEGAPADFLYVILEGQVELFARDNDRETTMAIAEPVTTFILAAALKDAVYLMSARTLAASRLLMIPAETVRQMIKCDPAFSQAMVVELANAFRSMVKALKNLKLRSAVERLANWLLTAHKDQGSTGSIVLSIDKRTLAALLGMTPENLSRAFGALRHYGIGVTGRTIAVANFSDLRKLAKPNPLIDDAMT